MESGFKISLDLVVFYFASMWMAEVGFMHLLQLLSYTIRQSLSPETQLSSLASLLIQFAPRILSPLHKLRVYKATQSVFICELAI